MENRDLYVQVWGLSFLQNATESMPLTTVEKGRSHISVMLMNSPFIQATTFS